MIIYDNTSQEYLELAREDYSGIYMLLDMLDKSAMEESVAEQLEELLQRELILSMRNVEILDIESETYLASLRKVVKKEVGIKRIK